VLQMEKGLDLDGWSESIQLPVRLDGGGETTFRHKLAVQLWSLPGYQPQWRSEQTSRLGFTRPMTERIDLELSGDIEIFNAPPLRPGSGGREALVPLPLDGTVQRSFSTLPMPAAVAQSNWNLTGGGRLRPSDSILVFVGSGPFVRQRSDWRASGWQHHAAFEGWSGSQGIDLDAWIRDFDEGNETGLSGRGRGTYRLSDAAYDSLSFQFVQRDEFAGTGPSARRKDDRLQVASFLAANPGEGVDAGWESRFERQTVTHSTAATSYEDFQFHWQNDLNFGLRRGDYRLQAGGGIDLQEQQYAGSLTQGRRIHLATNLGRFHSGDSLVLTARAIRYRYDTPDLADQNDRDELRHLFVASGGWRFDPHLGLRLSVEVDLTHYVNLHTGRSGENRWNRLYTLRAEVPWQAGRFSNQARYSVSGNYVIYDYDRYDQLLGRAFRSFIAADSLTIQMTDRVYVRLTGQWGLEDHGRLDSDEWRQDVAEDGRVRSISSEVSYRSFRDWKTGVGWTYHRRQTWEHRAGGGREPLEDVLTDGPMVRCELNAGSGVRATFRAVWLDVRDRLRGRYRLPDVSLTWAWHW